MEIKIKDAIIARILLSIIGKISKPVRDWIIEKIKELDKKAKETDNPIDDLVVLLLKSVFGIEE